MTDETPQPEGTPPSPASPEETPTAEATPAAPAAPDAAPPPPPPGGDEDDVAPAAEAPTQAEPVTAPGYAAPAAAAPVAAAAPPATADRPAGIFVPKWLGIAVAAVVAALIFGGIGYAIGDSSSDSGAPQNAGNVFPNGNGNQGNGNRQFPGGGGQVPGYGGNLPNGGQFPGGGQLPNGGQGNGNQGNGNQGNGGATASNAGFLGVGVQVSTDPAGAEITQVAADSPAAEAGLQEGDVITAIDGDSITSPDAVRAAVQAKRSGDEISVTYTRDGQSNTVKVTLTSRSQAQSS